MTTTTNVRITVNGEDVCACPRCPCCGKLTREAAPISIPTPFWVGDPIPYSPPDSAWRWNVT
jgi:hypothetical protein